MNAISKISLQNQPMNISQNAKASYMKQSNQPQEDTVTISNPAFKGKQVIAPKQIEKTTLALATLAATFFGGIAAKANAKLDKKQIAERAEELSNMTYETDYPIGTIDRPLYTVEEAKGIAEFMFDKSVYDELMVRLAHCQGMPLSAELSYDEVIYLGNKLKADKAFVDKFKGNFSSHGDYENAYHGCRESYDDFINRISVNSSYHEVIKLLKLHEINPKEVEELNNDFKYLSADEIEKIMDTYKKYPEKTRELLGIQNEIREIKTKISKEQVYSFYNFKEGKILPEQLHEKIVNQLQRLVEIAPDYIKEEVEPMLESFRDTNSTQFQFDRIPEVAIEDIATEVYYSPDKYSKSDYVRDDMLEWSNMRKATTSPYGRNFNTVTGNGLSNNNPRTLKDFKVYRHGSHVDCYRPSGV